jgi:hypothetical protein
MAAQAVVFGEESGLNLQNRFSARRAPEFLGAFHTPVEKLNGGLHVAARPRQSALAIARVFHSTLVPLQIAKLLAEDLTGIIVGRVLGISFLRRL